MAPHLETVGLPTTSLEASLPRRTDWTGHDEGIFGGNGIKKQFTNEAHVCSTNGVNLDFANGVDNDHITRSNVDQPIAIIGMGLRFPQDATSPEKFWEMLVDGRSARTEVPKERYNIDSHYRCDANLPDTLRVRAGHFLAQDIAAFDAPFFSINSTEAATIDPQQRLLLETTYEALENAGLPMELVSGSRTSVFMGSFGTEYNLLLSKDPLNEAKYKATGTALSMASNRLSWFYNLSGSSVTVDTACSSSLTALHLACEDLLHNKSEMSLVGGCNLILTPESSIDLGNIGCLSPDGISYSFDHRANGYSRGEGIGVVVIKPLDKAIKDGDMIRAVIRATGGNQDGRTVDIAQPSQLAQLTLIRETYACAGLSMAPTRYVEAHGTGTSVGDPIEIGSIQSAFKESRSKEDPLFVGAVKSNIGHLEATSGMAGLIKAVLTLEKGVIPGNIWFEKPNPQIVMKDSFIKFPITAVPWPTAGLRRASVSSYGFGGANAHIILDDAYHYIYDHVPDGIHQARLITQTAASGLSLNGTIVTSSAQPLWPKVFAWSAFDESALSRMAETYRNFLQKVPLSSDEFSLLENLAFTLCKKRGKFSWRSCVVAKSLLDLVNQITSGFQNAKRSMEGPRLAFVFTGQGAQWYAMGRELTSFPQYLQSLQSSQVILTSLGCTWSLIDELYKEKSASLLDNPEYAQPTCLALQIALTDLLESLNVHPTTVIGHSSGEIAAAYAMGAVSQESALRIAFSRGLVTKILQSREGREAEGMMAIAFSEQEARSYLDRHFNSDARIWIGCINSPKNVTITGSNCHIEFLKKILDAEGVFARKLKVDVAYHCAKMQEVALMYEKLVRGLEPRALSYTAPTMVSTVTGQTISAEALRQSDHWVRNLVSPVQFLDAINQAFGKSARKAPLSSGIIIRKKPLDFVLEIGPHSTLQGPLRETLQEITKEKLEYASMIVRGKSATDTVPAAMASLFCLGYPVDLNMFNTGGKSSSQGRLLTSLPSYPFDRSKKYWLEGRISKNARFSDFPHHDLLGKRDLDWNPLEAKWKSLISAAKRPWVEDHNIIGSPIYPGAGMLVMAIEAARQLVSPDQHITGFRFRDTTITKALVIPSSGDIETHFYLRPDRERTTSTVQRHEFRLCSLDNGEWSENCRGFLAVELQENRPIETLVDSLQAVESESLPMQYSLNTSKCDISFGSKLLYASLKNMGLNYGPSFRTLTDIFADGDGVAIGSLDLDKWKFHRPVSVIQPYVIHPAALDAMFQLPVAARLAMDSEFVPMVPTLIRNMWISGGLLDPAPKVTYSDNVDRTVLLQTKAGRTGFRSMNFSFSATQVSSQKPSVYGEVYCTSVAGTNDTSKDVGNELICFKIASRPELDLMKKSEIEKYCQRDITCLPPNKTASDQALLVCLLACTKIQKSVSPDLLQGDRAYLRSFMTWIDQRADLLHKMIPLNNDIDNILTGKTELISEILEKECQQLEGKGPTSELIARSARNIFGILTGELDLLEVFFHDDLMDEYYRNDIDSTSISKQTAILVDMMAHKNPSLRILEIGAGTGAGTGRILDACLCNKGTSGQYLRVGEYTFTDIAPSFLDAARSRFQEFTHSMKFAVLDIEQDPGSQGFEEGYYDLIVASNVLHATKDIEATLRRVKSLLKRGGKLLLHEAVAQGPVMPGFVFGMFPGWWLSSEPERKTSPLLSESQWHDYMLAAGFAGVEVALRDDNVAEDDAITIKSSVMISTNPVVHEKPSVCPLILIERSSDLQRRIAAHAQQKFAAAGYELPSVVFLDEFDEASYNNSNFPCCISLLELDRSMLLDADDVFMRIRALLTISRGILWVSNNISSDTSPVNSLFTGLARVLRSEHDWLKLCTLSLESTTEARVVSQQVFDIFSAAIVHDLTEEVEFVEREGLILINRATQAPLLNDHVQQGTVEQAPQIVSFDQARSRRLKLTIQMPGLLDTLQFVDHVVPDLVGPDEIEIRVEASGINFRDVLIALGQVDASYLGSECAGVVTQVGRNFDGVFAVGDRVSSMVEGSLRTFTRCHAGAACRIPEIMPFSVAASLPIIFATAYYSLHDSARIQRGESILIHSGSGGLGQACIQLAQLAGAEIYATVGTPEKRRFLETFYKIREDHIFSSRDLAFKDQILEKTQGRGVDVVINSLAGEALRASWEIIAPNGRFIEVGKKDIYNLGALPMFPFAKMATFSSVDLACLFQQSPQIIGKLFNTVLQLYAAGQISEPTPLHVFKSSDIGQAFRLMQNGKSHGKLVIEFNEDDLIPVVPSGIPKYDFDSNATYVLSGGLGGLGRGICRWMISRGARNFLLLSRYGPQTLQAKAFMKEVQRKGAFAVAPACDISDKEALAQTLTDAAKHMPPFKGCIQGAMQLCDKKFSEMTVDEFKVPLSSKVDGSWNLHTLLPSGLDFFVLLSSVSGACGTYGQANYAAANTYQDSLAQHRIAHGERTWVLDLGNFQSIGHWENLSDELAKAVGAHNYRSINEQELHAALEYYCNPALAMPSREEALVIIGLELPFSLNARGIEDPYWMSRPQFKHLYRMNAGATSVTEIVLSAANLEVTLAKACSLAEAAEVVIDGLREKLTKTLGVEKSDIDPSKSMLVYGVDSLAAVEIRTWFKSVVGADVTVFEILSNASVEAIATAAAKQSRHVRVESFKDEEE